MAMTSFWEWHATSSRGGGCASEAVGCTSSAQGARWCCAYSSWWCSSSTVFRAHHTNDFSIFSLLRHTGASATQGSAGPMIMIGRARFPQCPRASRWLSALRCWPLVIGSCLFAVGLRQWRDMSQQHEAPAMVSPLSERRRRRSKREGKPNRWLVRFGRGQNQNRPFDSVPPARLAAHRLTAAE